MDKLTRAAYNKKYRVTNREKLNVSRRLQYADNPEKIRVAHRKVKYGLTDDAFHSLLSGQKNCCALCKKRFVKIPQVDHCHSTGKIRGLLCSPCNTGLGKLGDSIGSLQFAIEYLKKSL